MKIETTELIQHCQDLEERNESDETIGQENVVLDEWSAR